MAKTSEAVITSFRNKLKTKPTVLAAGFVIKLSQNQRKLAFDDVRIAILLSSFFLLFLVFGLFNQSLHGKTDAIFVIDLKNLHANDLAFLEVVADLVDAFMRDLADVASRPSRPGRT